MTKPYRWIKSLVTITIAATVTSIVSAGLSVAVLAGAGYSKSLLPPKAQTYTTSSKQLRSTLPSAYQAVLATNELSSKPNTASSVKQAAQDAIEALSKHKLFASWKGARAEIQALGPGTHGYIVHVKSRANESLGYLIIYATEDGQYSLSEYGVGEQYPFATQTIDTALNKLEWAIKSEVTVTPYYIQPLVPVWKLQYNKEVRWADASSGDILPIEDPDWLNTTETSVVTAHVEASSLMKDVKQLTISPNLTIQSDEPLLSRSFDPYENILWMTAASKLHGSDISNWLKSWNPAFNERSYIFVQQLEPRTAANTLPSKTKMNFPFAFVGEQVWSILEEQQSLTADSNWNIEIDSVNRYIALKPPGEASTRFLSEMYFQDNREAYVVPVVDPAPNA